MSRHLPRIPPPMLRALLCLVVLLATPSVRAQTPALRVLRVCMTDSPHAPWRLVQRERGAAPSGLDYELLNRFSTRSGWSVTLQPMSGRRCLVELQAGRSDATVGLSFSPERASYLRYPMQGSVPDDTLALRADSYSLYHLGDGAVQWDGQRLRLPPGAAVEALAGQSIAAELRQAGYPVAEQGRHAGQALQRVLDGKATAAALLTSEAEDQRRQQPALGALTRAEPPLSVKPYFVVFSRAFAQAHDAELPALWRAFDAAAQFPAYQQAAHRTGRSNKR